MRFADIEMLRYDVRGFNNLSPQQRRYIYHLTEATLWGRDILWDQNCHINLPLRHLLEQLYLLYKGERQSKDFLAFQEYLRRTWFSNGIHHHYGMEKFEPAFSRDWFIETINECKLNISEELLEVIFNPDILAKRVNQAADEDLLLTSAMNYYGPGVTQHMAESFYETQKAKGDTERPIMYGMNSRLELASDGQLSENVWRKGGMYGPIIEHIIEHLTSARNEAENDHQRQIIDLLVSFYQTGDLGTFDKYTIAWVENQEGEVDFINGFTEVYGDPLGLKASWEGYVNITDQEATRRTRTLSDNAQWFEDHSPVQNEYKKPVVKGVSARVVEAVMLGGDLYPSSAIGINLPNSNWVRQEHGSKSVTIGNLTRAYAHAAKGSGMRQEFVIDKETLNLLEKYDDALDDLHTDLHECLGHGSGQLRPGTDPDALKAYGSTIEEARADLFALYYLADPKLTELGLTPTADAYKAAYYSYMMNGLITQLVRIKPGSQIEEAHMRNRALIARWCMAHCNEAMQLVRRENKTYLSISDYDLLRQAVATLLREIQRIKSEGDLQAAQELVEQYAIQVDATLHSEVLERYERLRLAPYKGFINPVLKPILNSEGHLVDADIAYDEGYDEQMLRYSREYSV